MSQIPNEENKHVFVGALEEKVFMKKISSEDFDEAIYWVYGLSVIADLLIPNKDLHQVDRGYFSLLMDKILKKKYSKYQADVKELMGAINDLLDPSEDLAQVNRGPLSDLLRTISDEILFALGGKERQETEN